MFVLFYNLVICGLSIALMTLLHSTDVNEDSRKEINSTKVIAGILIFMNVLYLIINNLYKKKDRWVRNMYLIISAKIFLVFGIFLISYSSDSDLENDKYNTIVKMMFALGCISIIAAILFFFNGLQGLN
tara:strand:- start:62 stop:448 length:387 start_codon:yes stop_codon:yes gene_type:complete